MDVQRSAWEEYQKERIKKLEDATIVSEEGKDRPVIEEVMETVREMLEGEEIGPEDNLVEAGLSDSISHMQLRDQLRKKMGLELPETLVTEYPTCNAIAQAILNARQEKVPPLLIPILYKGNEKSKFETADSVPFFPASTKIVSFFSWLFFTIAGLFRSKKPKGTYKTSSGDTVHHLEPEVEIPRTASRLSWDDMLVMHINLNIAFRLPYKADDQQIMNGLKKAIATYPSFTGHLEPVGSSARLVYGGKDASVKVTVGKKRELTGKGPTFPPTVDSSKSVANFVIRSVIFNLMRKAYSKLFYKPVFEARIVHVESTGRAKDAESGASEEETILEISWNHALADGNTINKFLVCWAAGCRGETIYSAHKGPFKSLTDRQYAAMADDLLRPGYSTLRLRVILMNGYHYRRLHVPGDKLAELKAICGSSCSDADAVSALLWATMLDLCAKPSDPSSAEAIQASFVDDLRSFVPELQSFSGNFLYFRPPIALNGMELRKTLRSSGLSQYHQSQPVLQYLARVIREGRAKEIYSLEGIEKTSRVPGCHLGEMQYDLTDQRKKFCLAVNDAIPGTRNVSMKFRPEGPPALLEEESIQWHKDMPTFQVDTLRPLADCPLWHVHMYGSPDGGVHFQLWTSP